MDEEKLLKDDDATFDAPLYWLVISDQVVKVRNQSALILLRRIDQIAEARRLYIQKVSLHITHEFLKTLSRL